MAEIALQDIVDYIDFVKNAKKLANMYKEAFEAYITDKSIPLDLRWSLWLDAPSELKDQSDWIEDFESASRDDLNMDWRERRELISTARLVQEMVQDEKPEELIEAFMEEILEKNLESFCFDW